MHTSRKKHTTWVADVTDRSFPHPAATISFAESNIFANVDLASEGGTFSFDDILVSCGTQHCASWIARRPMSKLSTQQMQAYLSVNEECKRFENILTEQAAELALIKTYSESESVSKHAGDDAAAARTLHAQLARDPVIVGAREMISAFAARARMHEASATRIRAGPEGVGECTTAADVLADDIHLAELNLDRLWAKQESSDRLETGPEDRDAGDLPAVLHASTALLEEKRAQLRGKMEAIASLQVDAALEESRGKTLREQATVMETLLGDYTEAAIEKIMQSTRKEPLEMVDAFVNMHGQLQGTELRALSQNSALMARAMETYGGPPNPDELIDLSTEEINKVILGADMNLGQGVLERGGTAELGAALMELLRDNADIRLEMNELYRHMAHEVAISQ